MAHPLAARWQLLAFDLDGTLADTESFSIPNLLELLAGHYGVTLSLPDFHARYHGMSGQNLLDTLNADYGTAMEWAEFAPRRMAALEAVIKLRGVEAMPGMLQMLRRVLAQGQQISLVSNSTPARIALTLTHIGGQRQHGVLLPAIFEGHCFSGTDPAFPNRASKPAPDVYLAAAASYSANPERCLAVEDSVTGVKAAVAAGFTCWGYTGAAAQQAEATANLAAAGASKVFHHWDDFQP